MDSLLDEGHDVAVIDDLSSGRETNLADALKRDAGLTIADIRDAATVDRLFAESRPSVVFHLAAQIDVRRSVAEPAFDLDVNVAGTINLLRAAVESGAERMVFTSTGGAIYGEGEGRELPLTEDADRRPDAPYGLSKLCAEGYLELYSRLFGLSTAALRLGNVYGPRQDPHGEAGVVAIFCGALLNGSAPKVFGSGNQTRDYVFVDDVVQALLAAGRSRVTGAFNVGTGQERSVLDVGDAIAAAYGVGFEPEMLPPRTGEVERISIDSSRARDELGWSAKTEFVEGLRRTAEWARAALQ